MSFGSSQCINGNCAIALTFPAFLMLSKISLTEGAYLKVVSVSVKGGVDDSLLGVFQHI
jgi:hypothetical protein